MKVYNKSSQPESIGDNDELTGSPGPTPGSAEGDRQTVEEDLRNKHLEGEPTEKKK